MPKFYVKSGHTRRVLDRPSAEEAILAALDEQLAQAGDSRKRRQEKLIRLGLVAYVSERGFNSREYQTYPTHAALMREGPFADLC